jgi:hypothetical protein
MEQLLPEASRPLLSAIVVTPDTYETVRALMNALKQQTAASKMEIVLVVPSRENAAIDGSDLEIFHQSQIIELPNAPHTLAKAEGVRRARAELVAFTEDHCFPAPNWAERLIVAHRREYAVVGPAVKSANPQTLVSQADFYIAYGKWAAPIESSEVDFLMGHNACYKRTALLEYDAELGEVLEAETALQWDMRAHGHRFWLEATTFVRHTNYEQWLPWSDLQWNHARVFAGQRAAKWKLSKRLVFALGSPLIPFVRFVRIRRDMRRARYSLGERLKIYSVIGYGLVIDALGQGAGYAFGSGDAKFKTMEYEVHRERYLKPA